MIPPVSASAAASAAPSRPLPDEVLRRNLAQSQGPRASAEADAVRVDLSPEGVAQSRAEAQLPNPVQTPAPAEHDAAPPPRAQAAPPDASEAAAPAAQGLAEAVLLARPGLSFSKADANEDGVVTLPEEHAYQARHLQQTQAAPVDARPDADYSEPIRTYRSVEATMAGI